MSALINGVRWGVSTLCNATIQTVTYPTRFFKSPITQVAQESILQERVEQPSIAERRISKIGAGSEEDDQVLNLNRQTQITEEALIEILSQNPGYKKIKIAGLPITDQTLACIAQYSPDVRVLDISFCVHLTQNGFNVLAEKCKQIQTLKCSRLSINDGELNQLFAANPNLKFLQAGEASFLGEETLKQLAATNQELISCIFRMPSSQQNIDDSFIQFLQGCTKLNTLDIFSWGTHCLTEKSLNALADYSKNLRSLNVGGNGQNYTADSFTSILTKLPNLIHFKGILFSNSNFRFTEAQFLEILAVISPHIMTLELGGLTLIQPETYLTLSNCNKLKCVSLSYSTQLTDDILAQLTNALTALETLKIESEGNVNLSGDFLTQITNKNLSKLTLSGICLNSNNNWTVENFANLDLKKLTLSQVALNEIATSNMTNLLLASPHLQTMQLFSSPPVYTEEFFQISAMENLRKVLLNPLETCVSISESTMAEFVKKNPNLISIKIVNGTMAAGDDFIQALMTLEELTALYIDLDPSISNLDSMEFKHLKEVQLLGLPQHAGAQLTSFMQKNKVINLTFGNSELYSEEIVAAIQANPTQTSIRFSAAEINDDGMNRVLEVSDSLNTLGFSLCRHITEKGFEQAKNNYPDVIFYRG